MDVEFKITNQIEAIVKDNKSIFTISATPIPSKGKTDAMWADYTKGTLEIKDIEVIINGEVLSESK
ncbi:hypothetical protein [Mesoplasma melaleucae]|uniref:Uncharacterized protein n=1 Tax=Mesoplasma melaleucae TaxID=81459 RepID=A0A2K8NWP3_9MOLU|nr:hypothetical protein [Mesoplasma melaleucae]ATZ18154.1 hypothetical protein EMELA_v1c06470 [Mesoplasma melaleucae]